MTSHCKTIPSSYAEGRTKQRQSEPRERIFSVGRLHYNTQYIKQQHGFFNTAAGVDSGGYCNHLHYVGFLHTRCVRLRYCAIIRSKKRASANNICFYRCNNISKQRTCSCRSSVCTHKRFATRFLMPCYKILKIYS